MIGQNDPYEKLVSTQDIILKKYIAILYYVSQFKVDRLQIILVAKKYISTCRNC